MRLFFEHWVRGVALIFLFGLLILAGIAVGAVFGGMVIALPAEIVGVDDWIDWPAWIIGAIAIAPFLVSEGWHHLASLGQALEPDWYPGQPTEQEKHDHLKNIIDGAASRNSARSDFE
jgi:hypothetical protein